MRAHFREEAQAVTSHLKGVHHFRKLPDMQTQYSSTVERLSKTQANVPTYIQKAGPEAGEMVPAHHSDQSLKKFSDFQEVMRDKSYKEYDLNERKKRWNKECGRKASVDAIITGTAKPSKVYLFADKISHNQVLAMTGTNAMPNPHKEPPFVPRGRKWLGEDKGWSEPL